MKTLPRLIQQTKRYLKKESPVILSCIGAAGVVATTVLAVRATLKAVRLLDDADEEKWQDEQEDCGESKDCRAGLYSYRGSWRSDRRVYCRF